MSEATAATTESTGALGTLLTEPAPAADAAIPDGQTNGTDATADAQSPVVPDEYAPFVLPEGMRLDEATVGEFVPIAKELGLSQAAAQKLADIAASMQQRQQDAVIEQHSQWAEAARTDSEFGGAKLTESLGVARKAAEAFGSPELLAVLEQTGLGNHPEILRLLYRVGKSVSNDSVVRGGVPAATRSHADTLFS